VSHQVGSVKPESDTPFAASGTPSNSIPSTLGHPSALRFWAAVAATGALTGLSAGVLTKLLEWVQSALWGGNGTNILNAAKHTGAARCFLILLGAGAVTGLGQLLLKHLSSGNNIDTTAAIWFHAGRLPSLRTLGSAVLSVIVVGMGVSLGREGAPKQAGSVFAMVFNPCPPVRRTAPPACFLWRGRGHGGGLRCSLGGRSIFPGSGARGLSAALYLARPPLLGRGHGCGLDDVAECSDVLPTGLSQFRWESGLRHVMRARGRTVFCLLCASYHLGRAPETVRMAKSGTPAVRTGFVRTARDPVSPALGQRQGRFAVAFPRRGSRAVGRFAARPQADRHPVMRGLRRSRRTLYAVPDVGRSAGLRFRVLLLFRLSCCPPWDSASCWARARFYPRRRRAPCPRRSS